MLKKILFTISLFFLLISIISCKNNAPERVYLTDFEYSLDGQNGTYTPIENQDQLEKLRWIIPNKQGYIWLKSEFSVPDSFINQDLSLYLGKTKIASKVFLNGYVLGTSGTFPPNVITQGEVPVYFTIPQNFLYYLDGNNNILQIQLWVDMQGQIGKTPFIGLTDDVKRIYQMDSFHSSKVSLIVSYIMLIVSGIYFILFLFKRNDKASLSFSRLCFCSSLYMLSMGIGEYPQIVAPTPTMYLNYLKFFLGAMAVITGYFAVSFIRDYLGTKDPKWRTIYRRTLTIIASVAFVFPNNMHDLFMVLYFAYTLLGIQIMYAFHLIFSEHLHKNNRIWSLLLGFAPVLLSILIIVIRFFLKLPFHKLDIIVGWQLTILTFVGIMIVKFARIGNEVEFLNNNLEKLVDERTNELQSSNNLLEESNIKLEFEKRRSEKEIALAAYVQQGFYKNSLPPLKDWDIEYYFKPLLGVSGDLYDFFTDDGKLDGFGIFDVSGHGIASGLVTMLVKNIIHQEFYQGEKLPLVDVMDIINNRVVEEKGSIENYLTGIIARVNNKNTIDFVNAGHPVPLHYHKEIKRAELLEANDERKCGVIGIPDLPAVFELQTITLNKGDTLLLYTDGIIEAENSMHESYGIERLQESFVNAQEKPLSEQINFILEDVKNFINSDKINDDITILLIHKK